MRSLLILAVVFAIGLVGGAAAAYFYFGQRPRPAGPERPAAQGQPSRVAAPGRLLHQALLRLLRTLLAAAGASTRKVVLRSQRTAEGVQLTVAEAPPAASLHRKRKMNSVMRRNGKPSAADKAALLNR